MKPLISVALLATLAACGGASTSPSENIVSSGGSLAGVGTDIPDAELTITNSGTGSGDDTTSELEDTTTDAPTSTTIVDPSRDASFATLLNGVRFDNGAGAVTFDSRLNAAAQRHADDMLVNDYFSHTGLNGSSVGSRVQDEGYNFARVGENIAAGYQTEASVLNGWVNSPGHQANNIDPRFEEFGLGYSVDGRDTRWVLVLGTEQ